MRAGTFDGPTGGNFTFPAAVGIGTTAPNARLTVEGDITLDGAGERFVLHSRTGVGDFLQITNQNAGGGWLWGQGITLRDNGNIGIGTTSPGARLDVSGSGGATQCCAPVSPTVSLAEASNTTGRRAWLQFHNAGESEAYIRLAGGGPAGSGREGHRRLEIGDSQGVRTNLTVTGNVTAVAYFHHSDRTLKTNIKPLENSLERILGIEGVSFNWREGGEGSIGFVAQDVEKKFPELVTTDKQTGLKSVNYSGFIAVLIQAMQEQQKQIERQETLIEQLKAEIERLR